MINIKNIYLRGIVKWKSMGQLKFDEEQEYLYQIVSEMSSSPKSICSIAPDSERYYIVNPIHDYFIVLTYDYIKLTNHNHHVARNLGMDYLGKLILKVRKRIERDHEKLEKQMFSNEIALLQKILKNVKSDNIVKIDENNI